VCAPGLLGRSAASSPSVKFLNKAPARVPPQAVGCVIAFDDRIALIASAPATRSQRGRPSGTA
jgi:hypothetical protein